MDAKTHANCEKTMSEVNDTYERGIDAHTAGNEFEAIACFTKIKPLLRRCTRIYTALQSTIADTLIAHGETERTEPLVKEVELLCSAQYGLNSVEYARAMAIRASWYWKCNRQQDAFELLSSAADTASRLGSVFDEASYRESIARMKKEMGTK